MDIINLERTQPFTTKDGSEIRELLAPANSCIEQQSLAEARLSPGSSTAPHYHGKTEEVYFILAGTARMRVGEDYRDVGPGDAIAIAPGAVHEITNTGHAALRFLCCCVPAYTHDDTVLV